MFLIKHKISIIIYIFVLILCPFFIKDFASAAICIPGTCSSCFGSNCCTTGMPATECGVTCPLCPARSAPYEMQVCCDEGGGSYSSVCCGGGCFTGETEIGVGESEKSENPSASSGQAQNSETKEIKDLKPGDVVESFNPETGEIKEGTVSDVTKTTREGYYILETEGGYKVKVTAEHPFLAIKSEKNQESINQVSSFKNKLKDFLFHTLTYRLITSLQAKMGEVLK